MKFSRKPLIVEARQHAGEPLVVVSHTHGQQTARQGDWLVGSEFGKVHVLSDAKFKEDFEEFQEPEESEEQESSEHHEG